MSNDTSDEEQLLNSSFNRDVQMCSINQSPKDVFTDLIYDGDDEEDEILDLYKNENAFDNFKDISLEDDYSTDDEESYLLLGGEENFNKCYNGYVEEGSLSVLRQMLIPFIIAGFGSTFAGIVLNNVTNRWSVFRDNPQFEIMIPAFIGLIGNIETTLASRLSTHANLGTLDTWEGTRQLLLGNYLVVLCQASVTGLFAALASILMSCFSFDTRGRITSENILLLCTSSVVTSLIANSILSTLIITVVVVSRKCKVNPDNISTPVAASMGDVCSLTILALISQTLYDHSNATVQISLIVCLISSTTILGFIARRIKFTKSVIITGWTAILGAVLVEQPGGMVMESAFQRYKVMSTFQPLVNGIGSNLVGIQTSRMSTYLHSLVPMGKLPESNPKYCVGPFFVFFSNDVNARIARLLMLVLVPAHLFFMIVIYFLQSEFNFSMVPTLPFILSYITATVIQLVILLYLAYVSVFWAWRRNINPDNSAIPFTSALADLLGNCLMAVVFALLKQLGDPNAMIVGGGTNNAFSEIHQLKNITM